jgi:hypothetical protein
VTDWAWAPAASSNEAMTRDLETDMGNSSGMNEDRCNDNTAY